MLHKVAGKLKAASHRIKGRLDERFYGEFAGASRAVQALVLDDMENAAVKEDWTILYLVSSQSCRLSPSHAATRGGALCSRLECWPALPYLLGGLAP
jgi:hypothetical protein